MKRIFVKQNYGGALTQELRILPGEYDVTDARLFGIADYLVDNGYAIVTVDEPEPEQTVSELEAELTGPVVDTRTNADLKAELDVLGISYKASATKAELLVLLENDPDQPTV